MGAACALLGRRNRLAYLWMRLSKTPPEPIPNIGPVNGRHLTPVGWIGVNAFCLSLTCRKARPSHHISIPMQLWLGLPTASVLLRHLVSSNPLSLSGDRLCHIPSYSTLDYTNSAPDVCTCHGRR